MIKFEAVLKLEGKTATGFEVPASVVEKLGKGQRPPVVVSIGDYSYRSTVAAYSGVYMLPLAAEHRARTRLQAGDRFVVGLELDDAPRVVEIPEDLDRAFAADERLLAAFRSLSYSNQRQYVESIAGAKTEATRLRRLEKVVAAMKEKAG